MPDEHWLAKHPVNVAFADLQQPSEAAPNDDSSEVWISLREASERAGVSVSTLRRWCRDGKLRSRLETWPGGERRTVPVVELLQSLVDEGYEIESTDPIEATHREVEVTHCGLLRACVGLADVDELDECTRLVQRIKGG